MSESQEQREPIPELDETQQARFDELLEDVLETLPEHAKALVEHVPIVVLDEPSPEMTAMLRRDGTLFPDEDGLDLCGLHTGVAITERSIEDPAGWGGGAVGGMGGDSAGPEQIHLFRRGICDLAGGWKQPHAEQEIYEEIRITLLHEIGHHFGLDEDDLDELGYA